MYNFDNHFTLFKFKKSLIWSEPLNSLGLTRTVRIFTVLDSKNLNLVICKDVKPDEYEKELDNTS